MKCPQCGGECIEGIAESKLSGRLLLTQMITTIYYPTAEDGKIFKDNWKSMPRKVKAYLCEKCRKVYAEYDLYPLREDIK